MFIKTLFNPLVNNTSRNPDKVIKSAVPQSTLLAVTVLLGWLQLLVVNAAEFTAEGNCIYRSYASNGDTKQRKVTQFSVSYRNGSWLIRTIQVHGNLPYVETGYDGESYKTFVPVPTLHGRPVVAPYVGTGILDTGDVPHVLADSTTPVIWLGYCAWTYIPESTNALLEPLFLTDHMAGAMSEVWRFGLKFRTQIDRTKERINSIVYWHNGKVTGWTRENASWFSDPVKITLSPPYNIGYTASVYRAESWQRVGELEIPIKYSYNVYYPSPKGDSPGQIYTLEDYQLVATNILSNCRATAFVPQFSGQVLAVERRFSRDPIPAHQFNYAFTNRWLSKNEAAKRSEYANQLSAQQSLKPVILADVEGAKRKQSKWVRSLVYMLFLGFAIAMVSSFMKKRRARNLQFRSSHDAMKG